MSTTSPVILIGMDAAENEMVDRLVRNGGRLLEEVHLVAGLLRP